MRTISAVTVATIMISGCANLGSNKLHHLDLSGHWIYETPLLKLPFGGVRIFV